MKRVKWINLVLILIFLGGGGLMNAQGWGRTMNPGDFCKNLPGITEKQKTQLAEISEKHRKEMDALRAERQSDRDAWLATSKKMTELSEKHWADIMGILTPEQKELFMYHRGGRFSGPYGRMPAQGMPGMRMMGPGRGMMMGPGGRGQGRAMMMSPYGYGPQRGWRR